MSDKKTEDHGQEPDPNFWESGEEEFAPCELCDDHDACEDFGCAFHLGLGHLVKRERLP